MDSVRGSQKSDPSSILMGRLSRSVRILRQNYYLGIEQDSKWGKPARICFIIFFLHFSCLASTQFPDCIVCLIQFQYCRSSVAHIALLHLAFNFWLHQHYLFPLVTWPENFSTIIFLNIYFILCLNITCIHSLHTKLCEHTTLNGLITMLAPVHPHSPLLS